MIFLSEKLFSLHDTNSKKYLFVESFYFSIYKI